MLTKRSINCAIAAVFLLSAGYAFSADLRVTDATGTAVLIREAFVDYGGFSGDKETAGIRIAQGNAVVTAKWTNIQALTVTGKEPSTTQTRIKVEVTLRNGNKVSGILVNKGRMKLFGKTDLGEYVIDLDQIRTITPVQ